MNAQERCVTISNSEYAHLISTEREAAMLRSLLHKKLHEYCGIPHSELVNLCVMLGIIEEKET